MESKKKKKQQSALGVTIKGKITINGPMFDIHDNQHVHISKDLLSDQDDENDTDDDIEDTEELQLPEAEELNYFAPAKMLKVMLQKDWFLDRRSDDKYTFEWLEEFIDALMASEWRIMIAQEWSHKDKRLSVRGNIIGTLAAAGVLKGSDLSISSAVTESNKKTVKTFAVYIGRGKKKPYCDWVKDYVNN